MNILTKNTEIGTKIGLLGFGVDSLLGTFEGMREVKNTAQNSCDSWSTISLPSTFFGLVRWNENKEVVCDIPVEDFDLFNIIGD